MKLGPDEKLEGCGDCDPCIGGRPDQCAISPIIVAKPMTPDEFAKAMREAVNDSDPALGHMDMDDLMVNVLKSLGYHEGVDVFENANRWYS